LRLSDVWFREKGEGKITDLEKEKRGMVRRRQKKKSRRKELELNSFGGPYALLGIPQKKGKSVYFGGWGSVGKKIQRSDTKKTTYKEV